MPSIVDYEVVVKQLVADGLKCNYPNGGSFGFGADVAVQIRGWIGPADETIRVEMRQFVREVGGPFEGRLAELAARAWKGVLAGPVWVMPASHWSFELDHGDRDWLPGLVDKSGVDFRLLVGRTNAAAIEFLPEEEGAFSSFLRGLLERLSGSDFTLAFPGRRAVCIVHHHKQLWWVLADSRLAEEFDLVNMS